MINFYKNRKIYFAISAAIMLLGIASIFINGVNLSIQFKGGAIIKYAVEGDIDAVKVEEIASKTLERDTQAQITEDMATKSRKVVLNLAGTEGLAASEQQKLDAALKAEFPKSNLTLSESNVVEPFIGKKALTNGLIAIVLSSIFIVLYVWFRFTKISGLSAGVIGLIALFHDVLVVFFTFTVFKIPLNDSFIAVTLTIIGYSINDTIVIYDRIRENKTIMGRKPFEELVNVSINQSLTRSINTSFATAASVLIVCIFAFMYNIDSIKTFALPMLLGIITGCYSTVCLAGPMLVMWHKKKNIA